MLSKSDLKWQSLRDYINIQQYNKNNRFRGNDMGGTFEHNQSSITANMDNDKFNYGFALLKAFMCFEVILNHLWILKGNGIQFWIFLKLRSCAVPVFMILSFYFMGKYFTHSLIELFRKRVWRIIYPQIGWAVIYCSLYALLEYFMNYNLLRGEDLFWQIAFGHSVNQSMWYQFDLLILTLLFHIVFKVLNYKKAVCVLVLLSLFSIVSQYAGIGYLLFASLREEMSYPLGRLFEVLPFATIGFCLYYFNVFDRIRRNETIYLLFSFLVLIVTLKFNLFPAEVAGQTHE